MANADYLLALKLQSQFNKEALNDKEYQTAKRKRSNDVDLDENLNATQNIVHPEWETLDPTPDIYSLFGAFDIKFFQGKLKCVELEWSKRMYTCAGICYQRRNRLGMSVIIRLSEPLLKLRARRDLIETLLHEMIHAYLFIRGIREANGGHGPNFHKIMNDINKVAGTKITVYHTFHDEVDAYKVHVWRCNGICQHRKPFYGWVKRTSNRAPGPNDLWYSKHQENCGGCFQKVSGPEPKRAMKKSKAEKPSSTQPKINTFLDGKKGGPYGGLRTNGGGTQVITNRKGSTANTNMAPPTSTIVPKAVDASRGNLTNVVGFKNLNSGSPSNVPATPRFVGGGVPLGGTSNSNNSPAAQMPSQNVRDRWANRFDTPKQEAAASPKSSETKPPSPFTSNSAWQNIDDDLSICEVKHEVIDLSDDDDIGSDYNQPERPVSSPIHNVKVEKQSSTDRQNSIRKELMDDDDDVIELIDDEFDETLHDKSLELLTDASVINDIFGDDTLMDDFNNLNSVIMRDPENAGNPDKEIIECPICQEKMSRELLNEHLEGCGGIVVAVKFNKFSKSNKKSSLPFYKKKQPASQKQAAASSASLNLKVQNLLAAGYTMNDIRRLNLEQTEEEAYNRRILNEMADEEHNRSRESNHAGTAPSTSNTDNDDILIQQLEDQHPCPVCDTMISAIDINAHLDVCLQNADA